MKKKNRFRFIAVIVLLLILPGFYSPLTIMRYTIRDSRVSGPVRIALITDLHSCRYGADQQELLDALAAEKPDMILLGGDIFDAKLSDNNSSAFLHAISGQYPAYFVTGNHEYWSGRLRFAQRMSFLSENSIIRLSGDTMAAEINGTPITLCGVDDPYAWDTIEGFTEHAEGSFREQVARVAQPSADETFTILLTHRPESLDLYAQYGFDLVLAGHAHGGQWRIPGILNGLYAPNQGLFPAYAGGQYTKDGTTMIVSRGLARESTIVPRFYNRPELVMILLEPEVQSP